MTTNQTTPGPWRVGEMQGNPDGHHICINAPMQAPPVARVTGSDSQQEANARLIVVACNACMAVSPDSPITVAECIPELVKLARLVTSRPEWQQAVDDLGLSNQIHKLLTCIERRHK